MREREQTLRSAVISIIALTIGIGALVLSSTVSADDRFADVKIKTQAVADGLHMLEGAGGNIAASVGADGTLIVDSQFAPLSERILASLVELGGSGPKYLLNTHFHGDHTGGNATFGQTAVVIAHNNVRARLLGDDAPASALPTITFAEQQRLHVNGDAIDVIHLPAGHTDGDSFIWFRTANVVHLGDHFFNGQFPFVDLASGGSVDGVRSNLERLLLTLPTDIQIIPGHGPLATLTDLAATVAMLRETQSMVLESLADGQSVEEIIKQGLGRKYRSWGKGFINEERWIRTLAAKG